jgi:hypothetical protein
MNSQLVLNLVYDYADIDTRIVINKSLHPSQRCTAMSFVEAKHSIARQHPSQFAKLHEHPDCLEIKWSDGSTALQDACSSSLPLWFSAAEPMKGQCNSISWKRLPKPVESPQLLMDKVLRLTIDIDSIDVNIIETRYIPSYIYMVDATIAWKKQFQAYIMRDDTHPFHRDLHLKTTAERIEKFTHLRQVLTNLLKGV